MSHDITNTLDWRRFCARLSNECGGLRVGDVADWRTSEGLTRPSDMNAAMLEALPRFLVEGTRHRARFDAWLADPYQQAVRNMANALYEMAKEAA